MEIIEIYDGTLFQAQMIKNLLENEGIQSFLKDVIIGTRSPGYRPSGGVKVMISSLDYDKAKLVVGEYERNQ